jgi:hypothetical protein
MGSSLQLKSRHRALSRDSVSYVFDVLKIDASHKVYSHEEEEEEFNRLPWLGQSGRAAAGCACTAAALRC